MLAVRGRLKEMIKVAKPTMREMFTMFEPKTFPTEIAASPVKAAMKATLNSGRDVERASKLKPTAVFPSWATSETLIAFVIAKWLA